eukprot:662235-Rhodomonas_salina.1
MIRATQKGWGSSALGVWRTTMKCPVGNLTSPTCPVPGGSSKSESSSPSVLHVPGEGDGLVVDTAVEDVVEDCHLVGL